jgi:hypothetical protein
VSEAHTSRPENGGHGTLAAQFAYFERWLTDLEKFNEERDRRYGERHVANQTAVDAAFEASKEATATALAAQEKAVAKAESSQTVYNQGHNDLLRKMDDQHRETLPRLEADQRFKTLEDKIEDLRLTRENLRGGTIQHAESKMDNRWVIGIAMSAPAWLLAIITLVLLLTK